MEKKVIQEKRMRNYFIQATQELLRGEGLRAVSVRNIADRAGYSYATLYNYFKDAKELIFECVQGFQNECEEFVQKETRDIPRGKSRLKAVIKAYVKYFIQYPGIFELFFLEKMSDLAGKKPTLNLINVSLDRVCADEWDDFAGGRLNDEEAAQVKAELRFVVIGMLLFYLHRNEPATYAEFMKSLDIQLGKVLGEDRAG